MELEDLWEDVILKLAEADVPRLEKNEVIQFGKDDNEERLPRLGFSLNVPGPMSRVNE